jgi:hypothetical protein
VEPAEVKRDLAWQWRSPQEQGIGERPVVGYR